MRRSKAQGLPGCGERGRTALPPGLVAHLISDHLTEGRLHGMVFVDNVLLQCRCGALMKTGVTHHEGETIVSGEPFEDRLHWNSKTDSRS